MSTANITICVDDETKRQFDAFCENVGLNVTTAIHLFIKTVLRTRKIPFAITDVSETDPEIKFARERGEATLVKLNKIAEETGLSEMTMEEIDKEIAACRLGK